jgi:hypothetical protein
LAVLASGAPASAQTDFQWRGAIPTGQAIEIKGVNGDVHASQANGTDVEVTATRSARRSNPAGVRFEVVPTGNGSITICAVYPDVPGKDPNTCQPGAKGHSETRDNDTVVHFVVKIPYGVGFVGRTVNGDVDGSGLQGTVDATTVNGSINVSTTGVATASTVNGGITATMGRADWAGNPTFKTVNGGITLTMPDALSAEVNASTVNGSITSDFPITMTGTFDRRHLSGIVGGGGHKMTLSTVNGSIKLLKGQ